MKKLVLFLTVVSCLLLYGCTNTKNNTPVVDYGLMDLAETYQSLDQITHSSPIVAEVKLTGGFENVEYGGAKFTLTNAEVRDVIKGDKNYSGQVIKIMEIATFNINLTNKSDKFLLFLNKYEGPVTSEEAFVITGAYQGKFSIDGKNKIKYDAADYNGEVTFQKQIINRDLNEFKESIKGKSK